MKLAGIENGKAMAFGLLDEPVSFQLPTDHKDCVVLFFSAAGQLSKLPAVYDDLTQSFLVFYDQPGILFLPKEL